MSQNPGGGVTAPVGSSVDLIVSSGQPVVPSVVGRTEANAISAITAVDNLTAGTITYEISDIIADGYVISQDPIGGTSVLIGSSVNLVVSAGPPVTAPYVTGMTDTNASFAITAAGLVVGTTSYEYA
ncbi:MAG: PASTA domain-containing protein, partial [Planctomycetota bacterium]